ncbi:MAG: FAD-binding domain-containing protein [Planctomycetota bacterium]|nr:FAD-binding domain-containing protein [Planctomycetota bacterium]
MHNVVWYRRDLRTEDHQPLSLAAAAGGCLPLYIADDSIWQAADASANQWEFVAESLRELRHELAALGFPLLIRHGSSLEIFKHLHRTFKISAIYSHRETVNRVSRRRDNTMGMWLKSQGIPWHQSEVGGVIPGLRSRDGWSARWEKTMELPLLKATSSETRTKPQRATSDIPTARQVTGQDSLMQFRQPGGRKAGLELLDSFLKQRGERYHREMSSPLTANQSCSRLSAHLTYGTLSMREVVQRLRQKQQKLRGLSKFERGTWLSALRAFDSRLHWHCHFIQKLDDDPQFEFECVHSGADKLQRVHNAKLLIQWSAGETGFPFIDACMRFLKAHGWINFRMRAMLASFASYHLWLDWRSSGLVLARLFTDYEPGIHWNQMQMQSGTTGINAPRIYNPVKQSYDQDPKGDFIKTWVPELTHVPLHHIHEPWQMDDALQHQYGCVIGKDYPCRIVDHIKAAREAREAIARMRRTEGFKDEAGQILQRHGSRKRTIHKKSKRQAQHKKKDNQMTFDL